MGGSWQPIRTYNSQGNGAGAAEGWQPIETHPAVAPAVPDTANDSSIMNLLSQFLGGAVEKVNPLPMIAPAAEEMFNITSGKDLVSRMKLALAGKLQEAANKPVGPVSEAAGEAAKAEGAKASEALAAAKTPGIPAADSLLNLLEAGGHGAAAAIPLLGPTAAEVGSQIGSGEPGTTARGAGGLLGLLAPMKLAKLVEASGAKIPKVAAEASKAAPEVATAEAATGAMEAPKPVSLPEIKLNPNEVLWRGGKQESSLKDGTFYTTDPDVAKAYAKEQGSKKISDTKAGDLKKVLHLDFNSNGPSGYPMAEEVLGKLMGKDHTDPNAFPDINIAVEESIPLAKKAGYDAIVVDGMPSPAEHLDSAREVILINKGEAAPTPKAAPVAKAPEPDVPLLRSELTGSKASGMLESALETSLGGATPFEQFRGTQQAKLSNYADAVVKHISELQGTPEEVGIGVQKALDQAKTAAQDAFAARYGEIDAQAKKANLKGFRGAPTEPLKTFATDVEGELNRLKKLLPEKNFAGIQAVIDSIKDSPNTVEFKTMHMVRDHLLEKVRTLADDLPPNRADSFAKKISQLADESMKSAAAKSPGLLDKVNKVTADYTDFAKTFGDSVIKKMSEVAPEKVPSMLRTASLDDIRRFKRIVPAKEVQMAKARMVRDMIDAATEHGTPPVGVAEQAGAIPAKPKYAGTKLSGNKLDQHLTTVGEARIRELFNPEEIKGIRTLQDLSKRAGKSSRSMVGAFTNYHMIYGAMRGAGAALATGNPLGLLEPAAMYGGTNLLARVLTAPGGAQTMRGYAQALEAANAGKKFKFAMPPAQTTARLTFWASRLQDAMRKAQAQEKRDPLYPSAGE